MNPRIQKQVEISLTITNDLEIQRLNAAYRGKDKPTDVLSFAFLDDEEDCFLPGQEMNLPLGDIIISAETAQRQACEYGHSIKREMIFLFVHGLLHLCGYDHIEEEDRVQMRQMEDAIMGRLHIMRE